MLSTIRDWRNYSRCAQSLDFFPRKIACKFILKYIFARGEEEKDW